MKFSSLTLTDSESFDWVVTESLTSFADTISFDLVNLLHWN